MTVRTYGTGLAADPSDVTSDGGRKHGRHRKVGKAAKKRQVPRAMWWIFANAVSARSGTLVIGLVLARMISPRELGAFAVVIVALLAVRSLDTFGVGRAILAWHGRPEEIAPTVVTISLMSGVAISAGCYAAAPAFAEVMGVPAAAGVIKVLALSVSIKAAVAAPTAMLQRSSPRRLKVTVDEVDNWVGVVATIGLAATGHGLISLAAGRIAGSAVAALLCVVLAPRALRIGFRLDQARVIIRAGLPLTGSGVLLFAATNVDLIIVGHLLSTSDLGFYLLALCLASWPIGLCAQPVRDIAPAVFARFRLAPRVSGSAFLSSANLLACLTLPVCILISSSAVSLIWLVYGSEWAPAAPALVWLAPLAALRAFYELTRHYLTVRSRPPIVLIFQGLFVLVVVPYLVAGVLKYGIAGAGIAQVVACLFFLVPPYMREVWRVGIPTRVLAFRATAWLAMASVVAWVGLGIRRNMIPDERLHLMVALLAALGIMGMLVYRMRTILWAVRGAATNTRIVQIAGTIHPVLDPVFEPPLYPVLTLVPLPTTYSPEQAPDTATQSGRSEQEGLGNKVRSATRWSALNTLVLRVANFAVGVLLARTVFGPEAFGLYAVSQVILAVLASVNELGVSLAIVRWDGDVRTFARTVFTLSVLSSTLFYCGLFVAAPYVARMLGSPYATSMIRVLCLCVIIDGLACVPLALLTRTFAQRRFMLVNSLNFIVSTGVTLWLAFSGAGPISFAWGSVAGCLTMFVAAMIAAPFTVIPGWNTNQARKLLQFGLPLAGASLLMLGVFNVDSAIVGAILGPAALGLYQLAFNMASWPSRSISEAVQRVSFAGFSRVAHSAQQLADAFTRALGVLMACTFPACIMLAIFAEPLIRLVYGQRWTPAAPVLTLLSILGLLRVAYQLGYDCLAAAGRRPTLLAVQAWWLATLIPVLLIGARTHGIVGVAAGHILVAGPLVLPAFLWALSRCGIGVRSILGACLRPFVGGVLMVIVSEIMLHFLGDRLVGMIAAGLAGIAVYLPVVFPMRALLRQPQPAPAVLETEARAA